MTTVLIQTDTRYPLNRKVVRRAVAETFKKHKVENLDSEVSVSVVGSRKMKQLTQKYLKEISKHQILTFSFEDLAQSGQNVNISHQGFVNPPDDILRLGDIVLCWPEVLDEASKDDMMVDDEVYDLVCHGVEHLLGYNHE